MTTTIDNYTERAKRIEIRRIAREYMKLDRLMPWDVAIRMARIQHSRIHGN